MGELFQPTHLLVIFVIFAVVFSGFVLVPKIFYILTLQRALNNCAPDSRAIDGGMLWLLLVPFVSLIWHFFVVSGMTKSLEIEFSRRNLPIDTIRDGNSIGFAMCICNVCVFVPLAGFVAGVAGLVLWIIYWSKVAGFSRILESAAMPSVLAGGAAQ